MNLPETPRKPKLWELLIILALLIFGVVLAYTDYQEVKAQAPQEKNNVPPNLSNLTWIILPGENNTFIYAPPVKVKQ